MARNFYHTTAEQVIAVVESICCKVKANKKYVEKFCDLSPEQSNNALNLAVDLGLLKSVGPDYEIANTLARFLSTSSDKIKASILRIILESYEPFKIFRERLMVTNSPDQAAEQTIAYLGINAHREEVKDTLLSLGTYANSIMSLGGGKYTLTQSENDKLLSEIFNVCNNMVSCEQWIRNKIGKYFDDLSRDNVIEPLANALQKFFIENNPKMVVTIAGNAYESFLVELSNIMNVDLTGATGIISKLEKFRNNNKLPSKIIESAKYIGHIRNVADHGIDQEIDATWEIQEITAITYIFAICSSMRVCLERAKNGRYII